jgi:hypothetical protein
MNNYEVLDKIKKLLRLGQSPNRHEAELAVQRAFELASRYQIDIESVSLEDDVRKIVAEHFPAPGRLSFTRKKILNLVQTYFNVSIVSQAVPKWMRTPTRQPKLSFIGKPMDIQIAIYVYDFLHTACAQALRDFIKLHRRKPSRSTQENFIQGFVWGVSSKLSQSKAELNEQQNALIVSEDGRRKQFSDDYFNRCKLTPVKSEVSRENRAASAIGFHQGQKVEIRKPLSTSAVGQLLLS